MPITKNSQRLKSRVRITGTVFLMEARFHNLFQIKFVELIFR